MCDKTENYLVYLEPETATTTNLQTTLQTQETDKMDNFSREWECQLLKNKQISF